MFGKPEAPLPPKIKLIINNLTSSGSTLAKAKNLLAYVPDLNVWDLAAAYGYGFIQNHVFVDGNKRVGLASMAAFLYLNGYEMTSTEAEEVSMVLAVSTGRCSQEAWAEWLQGSIAMVGRF